MRFVLIDGTGGATTSDGSTLTPEVLAKIAGASEIYLNRDVSSEWGGNYTVRAGVAGDIQTGEIVFAVLPSLPDAPGAIAYHDVDGNGVPVIWDGITLSDTLIGPGNSLSIAMTHELAETAGDEACNAWRDDGHGSEYAQELCDAVEAQSYDINGVQCSNFVLKAFFTPAHLGPYDHMSRAGTGNAGALGPFLMPSGGNYQIIRNSGMGEHQVQALAPQQSDRMMRRAGKRAHPDSRSSRRGVR